MVRAQSILTALIRAGLLFGGVAVVAGAMAMAGAIRADDVAPAVSPVAPVLPWNHAFTLRDQNNEEAGPAIPLRTPDIDIPASGKWGVSLNFDIKDTTYENMDRMSAGAYFKLSPRIRLGGSLSFSAPGEFRVSTPRDRVVPVAPTESQSAVRIESSIKF